MTSSAKKRKQQVRDYLIACGTAFSAAALGLINVNDSAGDLPIKPSALFTTILIFGGATALFFLMLRIRPPAGESSNRASLPPLPRERMTRMAGLWYGLSIVLSVGLVRQNWRLSRGAFEGFGTAEILSTAAAVAISLFAVWRLYNLWRNRHRNDNTESQ